MGRYTSWGKLLLRWWVNPQRYEDGWCLAFAKGCREAD